LSTTKIETGRPLQAENAAANDQAFTPVGSEERIQALDVVRGFALLGIFMMNV
jgi:uncharacterized membrane protein YeiB